MCYFPSVQAVHYIQLALIWANIKRKWNDKNFMMKIVFGEL